MESYEVVRVAHAALLSQGCEPVGREGSVGRPVARRLCGSCFTCGSRLEEMPARAKTLNPAPCIHHHVVTSPSCVPQSTAYQGVSIPCCRSAATSRPPHLYPAQEQIFAEAEQRFRSELNRRELRETPPSRQPGRRQSPSAASQRLWWCGLVYFSCLLLLWLIAMYVAGCCGA